VRISRWRLAADRAAEALADMPADDVMFLIHVHHGDGNGRPFTHRTSLRDLDEVIVATPLETEVQAFAWLLARGWSRVS
jgi:hypothetical protein